MAPEIEVLALHFLQIHVEVNELDQCCALLLGQRSFKAAGDQLSNKLILKFQPGDLRLQLGIFLVGFSKVGQGVVFDFVERLLQTGGKSK